MDEIDNLLQQSLLEAQLALNIAASVTDTSGQPVRVNGISQLSMVVIIEAASRYADMEKQK